MQEEQAESRPVMVIEHDDKRVLVLQGVIDLFSVDELYQAAHALLERDEDLSLDWEKAERLDTSALQILLALKNGLHEKGRKMQLSTLTPGLEKHFSLAGFAGAFS